MPQNYASRYNAALVCNSGFLKMNRTTAGRTIPERLAGVNPFRVMLVLHRAAELERQGRKIVHMEAGEPDFATAEPIREAAKRALDAGLTKYTSAPGIPELRDCLVQLYRDRHGLDLPRERILITLGASGGLSILSNLLLSPGDGVLLTDPSYPCYRNLVRLAGAKPQLMAVGVEDKFPAVDRTSGIVSRQQHRRPVARFSRQSYRHHYPAQATAPDQRLG